MIFHKKIIFNMIQPPILTYCGILVEERSYDIINYYNFFTLKWIKICNRDHKKLKRMD